jgi:hypothetical protein
LGEETFIPNSDSSLEFRSLLLIVYGMIFHKEKKIECMQWCHTECAGAENDMFLC